MLTVIVAVTVVTIAGRSFTTTYFDCGSDSGDCDSSQVMNLLRVASSALMTMVTTLVTVTQVMVPRGQ